MKKEISNLNNKYFEDRRIFLLKNKEVEIFVNDLFLKKMFSVFEKFTEIGINKVKIFLDKELFIKDTELIFKRISSMRYHFNDSLVLILVNIPYCVIKESKGLVFFNKDDGEYVKIRECDECLMKKRCRGILRKYNTAYFRKTIKKISDKPREIMIEIEEKCNLDCEFCFNKNSFANGNRKIENKLSKEKVRKIIDSTVKNKIPVLRFTGGEPLLRKDIWGLAEYAKEKKLELRLNTNGLLIENSRIAENVVKYFDNILMPIQYSDIFKDSINGKKKREAIKLLKSKDIKTIRIGTVATKEVIDNLEDVSSFVSELKVDKWELYRPIPLLGQKNNFTKKDLIRLVEGLIRIEEETGKTSYIINAIPFCAYESKKIKKVSVGADAVDGHERFAIDPRGYAKPSYYIDKNIGDPVDIKKCWNHPFMRKIRNLEYVPNDCKSCIFLDKCKGGCRFSAFVENKDFSSKDPLMDERNIVKY
jgi:radical SAM protein with 4Fe4S-binding SPASM domain